MRSDAAREAPPAGLVERFDALRTLAEERGEVAPLHALTSEEKGIFDAALRSSVTVVAPAKVSSPELASLAAKYVNMTARELADAHPVDVLDDVRRLAASVLSQA